MKNFLTDEDIIITDKETSEFLYSINKKKEQKYYVMADSNVIIPVHTVKMMINKIEAAGQHAAYSVAENIAISGGIKEFYRYENYYLHNLTRPINSFSMVSPPAKAGLLVIDSDIFEKLSSIVAYSFSMSDILSAGKLCRTLCDHGMNIACYMDCRAARILDKGCSNKKSIDILIPELSGRGGTEKVIEHITGHLTRRGYQIRFVVQSLNVPGEWIYKLGNAVSLHSELEDISASAASYAGLITGTYIPDMVISTFSPVTIATTFVVNQALNIRIPIVWWMHIPARNICQEEVKRILTLADAYLAISYDIMTEMETFLPREKIYLVNNPVDITEENLPVQRDSILRLAFVGRIVPQKRVDVLLNALAYVNGEWQLDIYGSGELEETLKNTAISLNISGKIVWHGFVEEPWTNIHKCSLLIMPSDYEGFCLSAVEALLHGIPVAITDSTGPGDYIMEKYNGFILPFNDPEYIAHLLNSIQDGQIKLPDPVNCRNSVLQYDKEIVCQNFELTLDNITI